MNNDDISHFSTIPASFAIKSNVNFIAHQYLIINNSQSQRALSVSVRTVWIYFASRRNCTEGSKRHCFPHTHYFSPICEKNQHMLTTKISQKSGILERTLIKPILKIFRIENKRFHSTAHIMDFWRGNI